MNKPLLAAAFSVLAAVTVAPPAQAAPSATIGRPTTHTASMTDYYKCIGGTLAWGVMTGWIKPSPDALDLIKVYCKPTNKPTKG